MTETKNETSLPLGETWRDRSTALARGTIGMVPVAGAILAEIVEQIIPNQRLERLEAYVRFLNERLNTLPIDELRERMQQAANIDLFEAGAHQAVRALSEERKRYIADVVASGIIGDDIGRLQAKRLLALLAEIDDEQIIILASNLRKHTHDPSFRERHRTTLTPKVATMGSNCEQLDEATLHEQARSHLIRLGLLRSRFKKPARGELPQFDEQTGMMKASYVELTSIGRMLLRLIGLADEGDV